MQLAKVPEPLKPTSISFRHKDDVDLFGLGIQEEVPAVKDSSEDQEGKLKSIFWSNSKHNLHFDNTNNTEQYLHFPSENCSNVKTSLILLVSVTVGVKKASFKTVAVVVRRGRFVFVL